MIETIPIASNRRVAHRLSFGIHDVRHTAAITSALGRKGASQVRGDRDRLGRATGANRAPGIRLLRLPDAYRAVYLGLCSGFLSM